MSQVQCVRRSQELLFIEKVFGKRAGISLNNAVDTSRAVEKVFSTFFPSSPLGQREAIPLSGVNSSYRLVADRVARYDLNPDNISRRDVLTLLARHAKIKFGPDYSAEQAWKDLNPPPTTPTPSPRLSPTPGTPAPSPGLVASPPEATPVSYVVGVDLYKCTTDNRRLFQDLQRRVLGRVITDDAWIEEKCRGPGPYRGGTPNLELREEDIPQDVLRSAPSVVDFWSLASLGGNTQYVSSVDLFAALIQSDPHLKNLHFFRVSSDGSELLFHPTLLLRAQELFLPRPPNGYHLFLEDSIKVGHALVSGIVNGKIDTQALAKIIAEIQPPLHAERKAE